MATVTPGPERNGPFARLWAAESAAFLGFQTTFFAIPLVGTLLLAATPLQLGTLSAAFFAPSLLYGLLAGFWADRLDRRHMLLQGDAVTLMCGLAVPLAALAGQLSMELLYVVNFMLGVGALHFDAAAASLLPSLVHDQDLVVANGRLQMSMGIARVAGPTSGGATTLGIFPLYAAQLGLTPGLLGLTVAAAGLGGIVGAALTGLGRFGSGGQKVGLATATLIALAQWLLPLAGSVPALAFPILTGSRFAAGAALSVYTSIALGLQQERTTDALRGRMFATVRFARYSSGALGALAGGFIGEMAGLTSLTVLTAIGATLSVLWLMPRAVWAPPQSPSRA